MFVEVSARQNLNIDELIDAVLLTADAATDLRANPDKDARGIAIEANPTRAAVPWPPSGAVRYLGRGDTIVAGTAHGRVRAMFDENGEALDVALPSRPVQSSACPTCRVQVTPSGDPGRAYGPPDRREA